MRIVISGSTSSGKTTLIHALAKQGVLERFGLKMLWTDERALLRAMGFKDMARMNVEELNEFQRRFVQRKIDNESGRDDFITEHSYVDCASYWVVRDEPNGAAEDELTARCRHFAGHYAIHILLPFGGIPFRADGYRSTDQRLHRRVANQIETFLTVWQLPHVVLHESDLRRRVRKVTEALELIRPTRQSIES
jgi:nicotinamide riboside kinase